MPDHIYSIFNSLQWQRQKLKEKRRDSALLIHPAATNGRTNLFFGFLEPNQTFLKNPRFYSFIYLTNFGQQLLVCQATVLGFGDTGMNKTDLPQPLQNSLCGVGKDMVWEGGQEKGGRQETDNQMNKYWIINYSNC